MIEQQAFGEGFSLYIIKNDNIEVRLTDYGANLINIFYKNYKGEILDLILGYDDIYGYMKNEPFLGSVIGRYANRIENASFTLEDTTYNLTKNDGENTLHSGRDFYNHRKWNAEIIDENSIRFNLFSKHLDQGFPGNALIAAKYTLKDDYLEIEHSMLSDQDTVFNPTNHAYFNMDGCMSDSINNHYLKINADYFMPTDRNSIVKGDIVSVNNSPFDFKEFKLIGADINNNDETLLNARGYDHNFVLNKNNEVNNISHALSVYSYESKIQMDVYTDMPGVQFYTANYLDESIVGKNNKPYKRQCAYCFETQFHPNSINTGTAPLPVVHKGHLFKSKTIYKLSVIK